MAGQEQSDVKEGGEPARGGDRQHARRGVQERMRGLEHEQPPRSLAAGQLPRHTACHQLEHLVLLAYYQQGAWSTWHDD